MHINQVRKIGTVLFIVVAGASFGVIYILFADGLVLYSLINGFIGGGLIGLSVAVLELYLFTGSLRKQRFIVLLLMRTGLYLILISLIILTVLVTSRSLRSHQDFFEVLFSEEFHRYIWEEDFIIAVVYTLAVAVIVNFTRLMNRKMGQGVLWSFMTGRYYHPHEEERIFMFLSLYSSDTIAGKLGEIQFHHFLNDFFYDITESILTTHGEIEHYVDDELVVSWNIKNGIKEANCIRAYFYANDQIREEKEKYLKKYGLFPRFKVGYHCGKVIRAEIGDVKSEIVVHGDVINTTSRISNQCQELGMDILLSAHLRYRLTLPVIYQAKECGKIALRGKETQMELFTIQELEIQSV